VQIADEESREPGASRPGPAVTLGSLVVPVYLPTALILFGSRMTIPFLPLFAGQLGAGLAGAGVVAAMRGVGAMGFDLPGGVLIHRIGKLPVMLLALPAAAAVALATGLNRSIVALAVLAGLDGGLQMLWMMSVQTHIRQTVPRQVRGRAMATIGGLLRIGGFAGPIAGGFLARRLGIPWIYFLQAVLYLASFAVFLLGAPRLRRREQSAVPGRDGADAPTRGRDADAGGRVSISALVQASWRKTLPYGLVVVALQMLRTGRDVLLPLWGDRLGLSVALIGLVAGIPTALELLLFLPAGLIMDRWGRKWVLVPCLVLLAVGLALVPGTRGYSGLLLVSILTAAGNGLGSGINLTLGSDLAPRQATAAFLGLWHTISDIGSMGGPLLIGVVAQLAGLGVAPLLAAGIGLAAAGLLAFRLPETLDRGREPGRPRG
jgi:MFS family permease